MLAWYATAPDREMFLRTVQEFRHIIEPEASAFAAMRRTDAQMAEIDKLGRILLPAQLKEYASCQKDVMVIGAGDHFEIWDNARWQSFQSQDKN